MIGDGAGNGVKGLFDKVCPVMSRNHDRCLSLECPVITDTVNSGCGGRADTGIIETQCSELFHDAPHGGSTVIRVLGSLSPPDKDVGDMNH